MTAIEQKTFALTTVIEGFGEIATREGFDRAGKKLDEVIALKDEIKSTFGPIVTKAHEAHKEALKQQKKHLEVPLRLETILKGARGVWVQAREREAEVAAKAVADAEQKRREDEAKKRAEDEALAKAEALLEAGEEEKAEEVLVTEVVIAPVVTFDPPPLPRIPEQKGFRDNWDYTITSEPLLRAWLWDLYPGLLSIDESGVRQMVKHLKEEARSIRGIEVTCRKVESVRR